MLPVDSLSSKANECHSDANAAAAYRDLPDPLRNLADELWAVHSNQFDYARPEPGTDAERRYDEAFVSTSFEAEHPLVRVRPLTGERGLFIGGFVRRILGVSSSESSALLKIFQSYVTHPEDIVRWSWSPGELLIFDNRITQHYAVDNYDNLPRRLNRVTVAGEVPVAVDGRRSRQIIGDASHYSAVLEAAA